jgi:hypothetical protein
LRKTCHRAFILTSKAFIFATYINTNMKNYFFYSFALLALAFSSCKEKETTTSYTMSFTPTFNNVQLDSKDFYAVGTASCQFTRFTLFLSDLILVAEDGSEQLLSEVEFLNFNQDTDPTTLMETIKLNFEVPNGKYKALKLGYGVKPSLNAKKPSDFPVNHILAQEAGQYWDSWQSYIFMKIEGKGSSASYPNINMSYHCGANPVYISDVKNISLDLAGDDLQTEFVLDLAKLFEKNGTWYDVGGSPATHSISDLKVATELMSRLPIACHVK